MVADPVDHLGGIPGLKIDTWGTPVDQASLVKIETWGAQFVLPVKAGIAPPPGQSRNFSAFPLINMQFSVSRGIQLSVRVGMFATCMRNY
jgi:hypothetical protein